jgi:uncharacterized repeat protein (TIGR03943 family)
MTSSPENLPSSEETSLETKPKKKDKQRFFQGKQIIPWLDVLALLFWGGLLLKYWVTGQLNLLIHPNYFWLVLFTGILLLLLGGIKVWQVISQKSSPSETREAIQHITLFPPGWGSSLLVVTAIVGFIVNPAVLTAQAAIQRGLTESLPLTREQPHSFRNTIKPEERTVVDWVRTLNAYPEPDAYEGQKAKVQGFVVHLPQLPDNYFLISRFILTCCAVDAYPVGIPVKLTKSRNTYPPDTWLEVEGEMITETLQSSPQNAEGSANNSGNKRQLILEAKSIKKIPTPANPYGY